MLERILVPLDGSTRAEAILTELRVLLARHDSEAILLRVVVPPTTMNPPVYARLLDERRAEARAYLQRGVCVAMERKPGKYMLYKPHIRFNKLGGDQFHGETVLTQTACPIMGPAAGFHPDEHRGKLREKGEQRLPSQAFPEDDFPSLIHPCDMAPP